MQDLELVHLAELEIIEKMTLQLCPLEEIADYLNTDVDALKEALSQEPYAKIYRRAKAQAHYGLRKSQFRLASESAAMAKFLGTNVLGQADSAAHADTQRHEHFHKHVHTLEEQRETLLEKFDQLAIEHEQQNNVIEADFSDAEARHKANK